MRINLTAGSLLSNTSFTVQLLMASHLKLQIEPWITMALFQLFFSVYLLMIQMKMFSYVWLNPLDRKIIRKIQMEEGISVNDSICGKKVIARLILASKFLFLRRVKRDREREEMEWEYFFAPDDEQKAFTRTKSETESTWEKRKKVFCSGIECINALQHTIFVKEIVASWWWLQFPLLLPVICT